MSEKWNEIHDFFNGFGMYYKESEEIIAELDSCFGATVRYIRTYGNRYIFARDVSRLLKIDLFSIPKDELDTLHDKLQILLDEENKNRIIIDPPNFKTITIPNINQKHPNMLDIFKN